MKILFTIYTEELEKVKEFIETFNYRQLTIDELGEDNYNYLLALTYDDSEVIKKDITYFYSCLALPPKKFKDLEIKDFHVDVSLTLSTSLSDFLFNQKLHLIEDDINVIDYICSDIVGEQEKIINKLEAIYAFLNQSGLIYYKSTLEHLLDSLHEKGIVDKEAIKKQVLPTSH